MKKYILINLNKAESRESKAERWRERSRWIVFSLLVAVLLGLNAGVFMIDMGYQHLIIRKSQEIEDLQNQIQSLQAKGKNLSKSDIFSLAKLEQNRVLWARKMELLGKMTPDDMALTGLEYKHGKLYIRGIATIYEDQKDFDIIRKFIGRLQENKEFANNFNRIKFVKSAKQNVRGQSILVFEIQAEVKSGLQSSSGRGRRRA
ncbi:MAG: PilN domain-containing protein [FCB group bacterium]|nr:PilN domain-containing protein [FCB group bacterium]